MKTEQGVTLVEVLAAAALLSIILLLASSVYLFGQKQVTTQTTEIQNQENVSLALDIITKEIRKASTVSVTNNILTINNTDVYQLVNNTINKNNQPLITNIQQFNIQMTNKQITITIEGLSANNAPHTTLSTTIFIRN
ncbi:competence type IV pilus minor pilin ComGF [Bacillus sp. EB600]|uniref:competence type IV pilus minor pilin ComGF n=1 Tax=Bacillus sp. EB600 TaxID=2806345 RepID=UPI00210E03EA|nr:prepilin-type N-terminal cleavage/methylation domain-containing protein [Bacillus sp. EB600]MCQ6278274.1 prepilin-type N-terminal cleavage/methylation domain-containing protein [Bacillus sp. EB600]